MWYKFLIFITSFLISLNICAADISAKSYIVLNDKNEIILQKNSYEERSIASITKLLVLATNKIDISKQYEITNDEIDLLKHTKITLSLNKIYDGEFLYKLSLIHSNNEAIKALTKNSNYLKNSNEFFSKNYLHTKIIEPSGLDPKNVSNAYELAKFANTQLNSSIAKETIKEYVSNNQQFYKNTNPLINKFGWNFLLSKTGYIQESGGSVLVLLEIKNKIYSIAILGASNVHQRWQDLIEIRKKIDGSSNFYVISQKTKQKFKKFGKKRKISI